MQKMIFFVKRISITLLLCICILLCSSFSAFAVDVRVLLGNGVEAAGARVVQGSYSVIENTLGVTIGVIGPGESVMCSAAETMMKININGVDLNMISSSVSVVPSDENCIISFNSQKYRDGIQFSFYDDTRVNVLNVVEMEHYLYGVVGREIGYSAPMEALKAQSVVSRTYAYANIDPKHRYDVVATISSQVYGGYAEETKKNFEFVKQAVDATAGEIMVYNGVAFPAYFSANAGGHTENLENVWGGNSEVPFIGIESPFDANGTSSYNWIVNYSKTELELRADAFSGSDIGEIIDIVVVRENDKGLPTVSGRVYRVDIIGTLGTATAFRDNIRSLLGLKSTLFNLTYNAAHNTVFLKSLGYEEQTDDMQGLFVIGASGERVQLAASDIVAIDAESARNIGQKHLSDVVIEGNGHGHGVGMSQHGAVGMANAGYLYKDIISYYYFNNENFGMLNYLNGSAE